MIIKTLELKPAIYSKAQTVTKVAEKLGKDPKQVCNTPPVWKGLVMEFILQKGPDYGQPVGTLDDYYRSFKIDLFIIHDRKGSKITVARSENGDFKVVV